MNSYNKENSDLLKYVLDVSFFHQWKNGDMPQFISGRDTAIELYVTPVCNQACEYCYLVKHGGDLYPESMRSKTTIMNNLRVFLNYCLEQGFAPNRIDVFSGEILHTDFGAEILDVLLEYRRKGFKFKEIVIPSNYSFLLFPDKVARLHELHDAFSDMGVTLSFSASLDGLIIDNDTRPLLNRSLNSLRDQEFYDKAFRFVADNHGGFHPMISAHSVGRWIENTKWWIAQCEKHNLDFLAAVMLLEVRNPEWTSATMRQYNEWLRFVFEWALESRFGNDVESMTRTLFNLQGGDEITCYLPFRLMASEQIPGCSIAQQLTVRLGDLSIVPCHRTSYEPLMYGQFVVEDNKITDIKGKNPFVASKILLMNQLRAQHGCDTCWNKHTCIRQCLGVQYEENHELFAPAENVCEFLKEKTNTIIKLYDEYGITAKLEELSKTDADTRGIVKNTLDIIGAVREGLAEDCAVRPEVEDDD